MGNIRSTVSGFDSVHLEVVIGNIMRWKNDPHIAARLKEPYDPILIAEKQLPGVISWELGLAFENFGQAIGQGMVSKRGEPSPIAKVLFGEPLSDIKRKRK